MTETPPSAPRRRTALVVRGGWDGHMPVETTDLFIPYLEENGFEVRVADSAEVYADAELMGEVDLIMQANTMTTISDEAASGLVAAIRAGTGIAGWHGGIADSYRASADYLHLIGGQFAHHAGIDPAARTGEQSDNYLEYTVAMTDLGRQHEITAGVGDFTLTTEQYWVLSDEYNDVLATVTQPSRPWDPWNRPVTSPAIWTRQWGAGRVFVCTPGHRLDIVEEPHVRGIIERGLLWAARSR